jgi:hypothetical protein
MFAVSFPFEMSEASLEVPTKYKAHRNATLCYFAKTLGIALYISDGKLVTNTVERLFCDEQVTEW